MAREITFVMVPTNSHLHNRQQSFASAISSSRLRLGTAAWRSGLFYRLNVSPIEVPSLRERRDDIPMLVQYFVDRFARKAGRKIKRVEKKILELLQGYSWPGNIRELQNVLERSVILSDTETFTIEESESFQSTHSTATLAKLSAARQGNHRTSAPGKPRKNFGSGRCVSETRNPASTLESRIRSLKIGIVRSLNASLDESRDEAVISPFEMA